MTEPNDQNELETKTEICKVCGDKAIGYNYGFFICNACKCFLLRYLTYKFPHKPCRRKQQCNMTIWSRTKCSCCRLKKCLALGMDPYYMLRMSISYSCNMNVPEGISPFPQCSTCSSTISTVNSAPNTNNPISAGNDLFKSENNCSSSTSRSSSQAKSCEVCGDKAYGRHYTAVTCSACAFFFKRIVKYKQPHKPCTRDQRCTITLATREKCPCCRLKKCLAVGMHPGAVAILDNEPKEWFFLQSCYTCDLIKIQSINSYIKEFQSFFTQLREHREFSALPSVKVRDETVQAESRTSAQNDLLSPTFNCRFFSDTITVSEEPIKGEIGTVNARNLDSTDYFTELSHSILFHDSTIRDTDLNHIEPTISAENDLQSATSNCRFFTDSITVREESIQGEIGTVNARNLDSTDYFTELSHSILFHDSTIRDTDLNHIEPTISAENDLQSTASNCIFVSDSISVREESIQGEIGTVNASNLDSTVYDTELWPPISFHDSTITDTDLNHIEPTISAENELQSATSFSDLCRTA